MAGARIRPASTEESTNTTRRTKLVQDLHGFLQTLFKPWGFGVEYQATSRELRHKVRRLNIHVYDGNQVHFKVRHVSTVGTGFALFSAWNRFSPVFGCGLALCLQRECSSWAIAYKRCCICERLTRRKEILQTGLVGMVLSSSIGGVHRTGRDKMVTEKEGCEKL